MVHLIDGYSSCKKNLVNNEKLTEKKVEGTDILFWEGPKVGPFGNASMDVLLLLLPTTF